MKTPRKASCHPSRKHMAHGLCGTCFSKQRTSQRRNAIGKRALCHPDRGEFAKKMCCACYFRARARNKPVRASCHPLRQHAAHGLCFKCYNINWYHRVGKKTYETRQDVQAKRKACTAIWYARRAEAFHTRGKRPVGLNGQDVQLDRKYRRLTR